MFDSGAIPVMMKTILYGLPETKLARLLSC